MMKRSYDLTLTKGQAKFLMSKFEINDPNKAIDFLIELMALERVELEPANIKLYIMKLMEKELADVNSK